MTPQLFYLNFFFFLLQIILFVIKLQANKQTGYLLSCGQPVFITTVGWFGQFPLIKLKFEKVLKQKKMW